MRKKILVIIILFLINVAFLLYYSSRTKNDILFLLVSFVNPFLTAFFFFYIIQNKRKIWSKTFLYIELIIFCIYFGLLTAFDIFDLESFHYERQTILFVLFLMFPICILFYFQELVKIKKKQ